MTPRLSHLKQTKSSPNATQNLGLPASAPYARLRSDPWPPSPHPHQVENRTKQLGEHHADTLEAVNNLALLLHQLGKLEEAEPFSKRKLAGCRANLGTASTSPAPSALDVGRPALTLSPSP